MRPHSQVPQNDGPTTDRALCTNDRTARYANTTGHSCVAPDPYVVTNLNQVVQFDTVFNHRVLQSASIYAGIGTNFHVIADFHRPELLNLFPCISIGCKAKTVSADHCAGVNDASITYDAIFANGHTGLEHRIDANMGTALHHTQGTNRRSWMNKRFRVYHCTVMDATRLAYVATSLPELGQSCKVQIRLVCDDAGPTSHRYGLHGRRHNDTSRL